MKFTIVVATCDRPERLAKCLDSLAVCIAKHGEQDQILVVDNGVGQDVSNDSLVAVTSAFSERTGLQVTTLRTEPRNKAAALNAGIAAAETDWLAFTDDDCLPDSQWLAEADLAATKFNHRVIGGRIVVGDSALPLPWTLQPSKRGRIHGNGIFVRYAPLSSSGQLPPSKPAPLGANVFVRRDVFAEYGGYDEELWALCGKAALGSEDGEFGMRLHKVSEPITYCHEAVVVHPLCSEKFALTTRFRHVYYFGWREAVLNAEEDSPAIELYQIRRCLRSFRVAISDLLHGDPPGAVSCLVGMASPIGTFVGRLSKSYRTMRSKCERRRARQDNGYDE